MSAEDSTTKRRYTVAEAAAVLNTTGEAVRSRVKRGTLESVKDGSTVYVLLTPDQTPPERQSGSDQTTDQTRPGAREELVEELRDRVRYLEKVLDEEREARTEERRRQDTVIAQLSAANAEQARALRSIEGPRDRAHGGPEPTLEGEDTTDATVTPMNLTPLLVLAPIGPAAVAGLFEASIWGPPWVQILFYVLAVSALLPAALGFVYGRNEVVRAAAIRARLAANKDATGSTDDESPTREPDNIARSAWGALLTTVGTVYLAGGVIGLLHGLYSIPFSPTMVLVPVVSSVLAGLLWISFAFLGRGVQLQRAPRRPGARRGTVNWQVIIPLITSLVATAGTVVAAVWAAKITAG